MNALKKSLLALFFALLLPQTLSAEVVWSGEQPIDWTQGQVLAIGAQSFATAKVNDVLRFSIRYTGNSDWPQMLLFMGNGQELPDAPVTVISATTIVVRYTITSNMLYGLMGSGLLVSGMGCMLTSVQVVPSADLSVLQGSVPVENDWQWFAPDKPTIHINIGNPGAKETEAHAQLVVATDKGQLCTILEENVTVGAWSTATAAFNLDLAPGFYQCAAMIGDEVVHQFVISADPDKIISPPDMQEDFGAFWQRKKDELRAIPMDFRMTEIPEKSTENRKVYLLEVRSLSDATGEVFVRAYYAEPVAPGRYPALIHYCGYDTGDVTEYCMSGDDIPGFIELYVSIRGQFLNNTPPYTINPYGSDYFSYGFGDRDNYFYCGAYLDALRAVDFVCSLEKAWPECIFAEGSSQGGALTIAAAALSDVPLKAIAPGMPAMGDFPNYFQLTSWPASSARTQKERLGMTEEEMYRFLSYFDTKNLATMISSPVYLNYSLQDDICPPRTNWAFLNNVRSELKKYLVNVTYDHRIADNWTYDYMNFFFERLMAVDDPGVPGDVNGDGVVDVADIAAVINVVAGDGGQTQGTATAKADLNGDGVVDVADIAAIINVMAIR